MASWTEDEFAEIDFNDSRLNSRFAEVVDRLSANAGQSIQMACVDWSNTKAAYRFFSNAKVSASEICAVHARSTSELINLEHENPKSFILSVQDTTFLNYSYQKKTPGLGEISNFKGSHKQVKTVGFILHSCLALNEAGVPLGLIDQKLWTRARGKIGNIIKSGKNMTRIPIEEKESFRWIEAVRKVSAIVSDPSRVIHIGDRESDIFEFFHEAREQNTNFLVRIRDHQRCLVNGKRIFDPIATTRPEGVYELPIKSKSGKMRIARIAVRFYPVRIRPSIAKLQLEPIAAFVIAAIELNPPKGEEKIDWRLLTNLPIKNFKDALQKIKFYEMRWQIEIYHKVLKSGCRVEDIRLRRVERISRYLAVMTIVAWRLYWMSLVSRKAPDLPASAVFAKEERRALKLFCAEKNIPLQDQSAHEFVRAVASLGGFLARTGDGDPGPLVLWRGYLRLQDIVLGISLAPP